jgi:hypothetical protein
MIGSHIIIEVGVIEMGGYRSIINMFEAQISITM